jgi:hypothetical protein
MMKQVVSWGLVGVFTFLWWWLGHGWDYLNAGDGNWPRVFWIFTLISLVVLLRSPRSTDAGMLGGLTGTVGRFLPKLGWLILVAVVMQLGMLVAGNTGDPVDHLVHSVVTALAAGVATSLWFGAVANADGS